MFEYTRTITRASSFFGKLWFVVWLIDLDEEIYFFPAGK